MKESGHRFCFTDMPIELVLDTEQIQKRSLDIIACNVSDKKMSEKTLQQGWWFVLKSQF